MKLKKMAVGFITAIVVSTGIIATAAPAQAALLSCTGYVSRSKTVTYNAFAGHAVRASFTFCFTAKNGQYGPYSGIRTMNVPVISFPSRVPGSFGETLKLITKPYWIAYATYRFGVEQSTILAPWLTSNFDFNVQLNNTGSGRICFVGGACSGWQ